MNIINYEVDLLGKIYFFDNSGIMFMKVLSIVINFVVNFRKGFMCVYMCVNLIKNL